MHPRLAALTASRDALSERLDRARPKKGSREKSGQWWRRDPEPLWRRDMLVRREWVRYSAAEMALGDLRASLRVPVVEPE